jgi:predicted nucleotidyltransferase
MDLSAVTLEALRHLFDSQPEVCAAYVFGSRASGTARPDSDLDLGVLYRSRQPLDTTLQLEARLEAQIGLKVDLTDLGRASPFLALDIVRGERIFVGDRDEADRFELYVLRRAGDLLPFERARQALVLGVS